ncbi:hypothetical protein HUA76_16855 [Myxococcus sp. CA056]|uniref:hypothetical protein n=1 Tax=Myxococcus sp. CA056 TaxID=2741740 RepID=UPI00157A4D68|nr:hypothetical protein [Myxococcus sp. CA056]NTX12468.1 hypothetical protein [Myxococcus sp. CA056]
MRRMEPWVIAVGFLALSPLAVEATEPPRVVVSKARSLSFTRLDAVVGLAEEVRMGMMMRQDFHITAPGTEPEPIDVSTEMAQTQVFTVLEAKGPVVTRAKLAYGDVVEVTKDSRGQQQRRLSPVSQKTYVGEFRAGRIEVTDAEGQPVTPEEAEAVRKDLEGLGAEDPIAVAFPRGPVKVGAKLDGVARAFEKLLRRGNLADVKFRKTRVQLKEIHEDPRGLVGLFLLSTTLERASDAQNPLTTTITYQGTMSVLGEGTQLTAFNLQGPVVYTLSPAMKAQGMKVDGKGDSVLFFSVQPAAKP